MVRRGAVDGFWVRDWNGMVWAGPGGGDVQSRYSGRTGGRLFSAGSFSSGVPIMIGAGPERLIELVVIEPTGKPDLIIRCDERNRPKTARISGRNGRLVWEAPLVDDATVSLHDGVPILFDEVNGDGELDALFVTTHTSSSDSTECVLHVISLRDGKPIWSQPVGLVGEHQAFGNVCAGDLDGDSRPEVVVLKRRTTWGEGTRSCKFAALDGRDGKTRWTWKSGVPTDSIVGGASVALVDLDGDGTREVCSGRGSHAASCAAWLCG